MAVVQLKGALSSAPRLLTFYVVRSYWQDRSGLKEGKLQQFANMESALRAAKHAAVRAPLVRVFRVRGNSEADYWEDPLQVAAFRPSD